MRAMLQNRFYVNPKWIKGTMVKIRGTDVWHITKVLRFGEGDRIYVFDGTGKEYYVLITEKTPKEVTGVILEKEYKNIESPLKITLAQALPKATKMDLIVQKATELGVHRIIPLKTERVETKTDIRGLEYRRERWQRISIEAAKQSGRVMIPEIEPIISLESFLSREWEGLKLLFWEEEKEVRFRQVLEQQNEVHEVVVVIGPEGGFSSEEVKKAKEKGFSIVSLGPRILRTESVPIVVLGILQYEWGDF
jgi:16S rRNA (uracil1498-N3)-methyltransferase